MWYQKKQDKNEKEFNLLADHQATKLFLVLYFNDFCFDWQLSKKFNIKRSQIQDITEKLDELGLISFRLLSELSEELQEAIMKVTPNFQKIYNENPKTIIITPYGKSEGKAIIEEIVRKANTHQGLADNLNEINKWSASFRKVKKQILKEERIEFPRLIKHPNGIIQEKITKAQIKKLAYLKEHFHNFRNEKKAGTSIVKTKKQELDFHREAKLDLETGKDYRGIYSHLNNYELDKLSEPLKNSEVRKLDQENKREVKQKLKEAYNYRDIETKRICNEWVSTKEDELNYSQGLDYLNYLGEIIEK